MNKRQLQLGMPYGTAFNRLRKEIMFSLVTEAGRNRCFRCGRVIATAAEFSVDHKEPWLDADNAIELFFSLGNIGFSHHACNARAARRATSARSPEERRKIDAERKRRSYTTEWRRQKFRSRGY